VSECTYKNFCIKWPLTYIWLAGSSWYYIGHTRRSRSWVTLTVHGHKTSSSIDDWLKSENEVGKASYGTMGEKQTWSGNCKQINTAEKSRLDKNVAIIIGATSSDGFSAKVNSRSRSLYAIAVPCACLSSVCNVRAPILSRWKFSAIFLRRLVPWPSIDIHGTFYGDRPGGTPP